MCQIEHFVETIGVIFRLNNENASPGRLFDAGDRDVYRHLATADCPTAPTSTAELPSVLSGEEVVSRLIQRNLEATRCEIFG